MKSLVLFGAVLTVLGLIGLAVPYITTQQTHEVAQIGPLKVNATEDHTTRIPPLAAGAAAAIGVVLLGFGLTRRA